MKSFYALIFLVLLLTNCQSGTEKKPATSIRKAPVLVIAPTIQEKLYERPTVKGFAIAMVQPQERLQVTDTTNYFSTNYFFYKVKLRRPHEVKEGHILKAAFAGKPYLIDAGEAMPIK